MRKLLFSCLISLFTVFSCLGLAACDNREVVMIDGYGVFVHEDGMTCTIVKLPSEVCAQTTWKIPARLDEYQVTQVGDQTQRGFMASPTEMIDSFGHVRKITIPESVKTIRAENLQEVLIFESELSPSNTELIADYYGLYDCFWWLAPQEENPGEIEYKYLTEENFVGDLVFITEEETQTATLLCALGDGDLTVPQTFNGLPVTKIADRAFYKALYTSVVIEENIVELGTEIFSSSKLWQVSLPSNCEVIPQGMFRESGLSSIELPNSVTAIGDEAFFCSSLAEISFSDSLTDIGKWAFSGCYLTSLTLPSSVDEVGYYAFKGCPLTFVDLSQTQLTALQASVFQGCPLTDNVILPDSMVTIGASAFSDTQLTSFTFPSQLKKIERYAFSNVQLQEINLPDNLESIGDSAFSRNLALTELRLPDACANFDGTAVQGCTNLKILHLNNVESCSYIPIGLNLTKFTVSETNPVLYVKDEILYRKNANGTHTLIKCLETTPCERLALDNCLISFGAFYNHPTLKEIIINFHGFEYEIPNAAFQGCTALEKVRLPNVDKIEIGADAFRYCAKLSQINTEKVWTFASYAFDGCSSLTEVDFTSARKILGCAFDDCDLREVHTYHVAEIGTSAFSNNVNLKKVTLENCYKVNTRAFQGCKRLTSFSAKNANISEDAFAGTPLSLTKGCRNNRWVRIG